MHLDAGGIERNGFNLDPHDLRLLQLGKHPVQDAGLGPTVHSRVNGVPVAKSLGKASPFAAVLGHVKNGVEHLQVGHADIAALYWQAVLDLGELCVGDLHGQQFIRSGH